MRNARLLPMGHGGGESARALGPQDMAPQTVVVYPSVDGLCIMPVLDDLVAVPGSVIALDVVCNQGEADLEIRVDVLVAPVPAPEPRPRLALRVLRGIRAVLDGVRGREQGSGGAPLRGSCPSCSATGGRP